MVSRSEKHSCVQCGNKFTIKTLQKYDGLRCKRCFDRPEELGEEKVICPIETPQARGFRLEDEIERELLTQAPDFISLREHTIHKLYGDSSWGIDHLIYDENRVAYLQAKATKRTLLPNVNHFIRAVQHVHKNSEHSEKPFLALWVSTCEPTEGAINAFYQVTTEDHDFRFLTTSYEELPSEVTHQLLDFFEINPNLSEHKDDLNTLIDTHTAKLLSTLPEEDATLLLQSLDNPHQAQKLLRFIEPDQIGELSQLFSLLALRNETNPI